jgi:hypothetical protein
MPRLRLTPWLRRGVEAAVVAAIVAIASLVGGRLSAGAGPYTLPDGLIGGLVLAPARIFVGAGDQQLSGGLLVALLALGPAVMGLLGGQLLTPLGFGRRAGAVAAILAAIVSFGVLAILAVAR